MILGAPGSGKGTQGQLLADHLGIPKVSSGELLRAAVRVLEADILDAVAGRFAPALRPAPAP